MHPLRGDLLEWRLKSGNPDPGSLVFPSATGRAWREPAYQSWRRRSFDAARDAAGVAKATPYHLRHSFASLLLYEGRSVIYVARQLGQDARLTLTRYGHVIDELEDSRRTDAEEVIREARQTVAGNIRVPSQFPADADVAGDGAPGDQPNPGDSRHPRRWS